MTQGHIVDSRLIASSQLDVLIADSKGSPVLSSEDKVDYLAYESVYAFGEIKSAYYKSSKPIEKFIAAIEKVNNQLQREKSSVFQITQDIKYSGNNFDDNMQTKDGWFYRNPLFKFMFFGDSKSVTIHDLYHIVKDHDPQNLPNIICFLDKGILVQANMEIDDTKTLNLSINENNDINWTPHTKITGVGLYPEFNVKYESEAYNWFLLEFDNKNASCLAYLIYALNYHLSRCIVLKADLMKYHQQLFHISSTDISHLNERDKQNLARAFLEKKKKMGEV
ncbi:MAG: hypothetical protein EOP56_11705 [Sphingobacteriales bacterium]|nr:MAG: hypothetical protein EOP56_11705 [Sphingobacteriales bacterium]